MASNLTYPNLSHLDSLLSFSAFLLCFPSLLLFSSFLPSFFLLSSFFSSVLISLFLSFFLSSSLASFLPSFLPSLLFFFCPRHSIFTPSSSVSSRLNLLSKLTSNSPDAFERVAKEFGASTAPEIEALRDEVRFLTVIATPICNRY